MFTRRLGNLAIIFVFALATTAGAKRPPKSDENLVQLAILLDTSSSMDGLIEQAKAQLWKVVNELTLAKRRGMTPRIEVALYEYGKSNIPKGEGYLRQVAPLTTDLDLISEELFKLTTQGGDEYCGRAIEAATTGLAWSKSPRAYKTIFIAGNEGFGQGPVPFKKAIRGALSAGVTVNTIFCGPHQKGIQLKWKEGADLADGVYMNIDQNRQVAQVVAPQDEEIARLGQELNRTYLSYGSRGRERKARQAKQDSNAESLSPSSYVQRTITKSKKQYDNKEWDLVDAEKAGAAVEEMEEEALPDEMQKMSKDERKTYVAEKSAERARLQKRIEELSRARRDFVASKKKDDAEKSLDEAIIDAVRQQAAAKSYAFE